MKQRTLILRKIIGLLFITILLTSFKSSEHFNSEDSRDEYEAWQIDEEGNLFGDKVTFVFIGNEILYKSRQYGIVSWKVYDYETEDLFFDEKSEFRSITRYSTSHNYLNKFTFKESLKKDGKSYRYAIRVSYSEKDEDKFYFLANRLD